VPREGGALWRVQSRPEARDYLVVDDVDRDLDPPHAHLGGEIRSNRPLKGYGASLEHFADGADALARGAAGGTGSAEEDRSHPTTLARYGPIHPAAAL
jgi:hypothetical protein